MTLDLTLELRRLASPAKPRIEDWVAENLPGWHIEDWSMAELDDEFEPIRPGAISRWCVRCVGQFPQLPVKVVLRR